ncbi:hypothetical protein K439DRAFT_1392321, partial [Ramaria rubella]
MSMGLSGNTGSDANPRVCTGPGGATIELGPNMWTASGLKVDSAPTDVVWARGNFDNKIVTSARNGEIIYWDINRLGSKYETRIKEHKRAVNKLALSPFLPYLFASGSQDGHLRVWDLRTPPASSMKVYHPTGIRALSLSPVPSNPLTVCTGLESGNVQRWDLRNRALPLERITLAHSSSVLSMDWQLPSMKETGLGWLVTSGMDRRVKIWNLCLSSTTLLPSSALDRDAILLNNKMGPRALRTLHTSFPVRSVQWRPGYDCEVAVVSNNESESETVEIWDVRRGWIGKWALEGAEGGITDIAFSDSHKLWAQHANGTFAQHDLREATRPLDAIPRVALSFAACGALAFVANKQPAVEIPFDDVDPRDMRVLQEPRIRPKATSDPVFVPYQQTLAVQDIPTALFDHATFARLAHAYAFTGEDRLAVCEANAEKASEAGHFNAAQAWLLLHAQLTPPADPAPSSLNSHSLRTPSGPHPSQHPIPGTRISSASASITSIPASVSASRPSPHGASRIDTRPMEDTSPSRASFLRRQERDRDHAQAHAQGHTRGQETPPSSSPSPHPRTVALPPHANRPAWADVPPTSPYDASKSGSGLGNASGVAAARRSSAILPVTPRARPSLHRAAMSSPMSASPVTESPRDHAHTHTHKHAHVGEGALDDSDSDSSSSDGSEAGNETAAEGDDGGGSNNSSGTVITTPSGAATAARLSRNGRPLPSPLSQVLHFQSHADTHTHTVPHTLAHARDESPGPGHLASDERSVHGFEHGYDSDAWLSHSPQSSSSSSESESGASKASRGSSPSHHPREHHAHAHARVHTRRASRDADGGPTPSPRPHPSPHPNRNLSLSSLHSLRSPTASKTPVPAPPPLTHRESHSTIRTVTAAGSETAGPHAHEADELQTSSTGAVASSEGGVSTRRPSPQRHRLPGPALALGLSNMEDVRPAKTSGQTFSTMLGVGAGAGAGPMWSEARVREMREDEARLREIGWAALRERLEWFAEQGDVQMCALMAVVAPVELGVGSVRAERFVEAYVDLLSRLQLHALAAHVRKYVPCQGVRDTTQVQTTIYATCGQCRTPVKAYGAALCGKCKALPTLCAICHLPVRKLLVHCPGCGHGGHQTCYRAFYLTRPLSELPAHHTRTYTPVPAFPGAMVGSGSGSASDSYASTDAGSTMYYSLSDGER